MMKLQKENPYDGKKIQYSGMLKEAVKKGIIATTMAITLSFGTISQVGEPFFNILFDSQETMMNKKIASFIMVQQMEMCDTVNMATDILDRIPTEEEQYIQFYSDVYSLDSKQVYQILSDLTDHFQDEDYLNHYVIGNSMLKGRPVKCESKEMAILIAVRNIAFKPGEYGKTYGELYTGVEYVSEWDYSHQIAYVSNVVGVDPALNYAICWSESSLNSPMFLRQYNPSGIMFGNKFATFPSSMAGFIEQALELLKYQNRGITTIDGIGAFHAPNTNNENPDWISNVYDTYWWADQRRESLFSGDMKVKVLEKGQRLEK